MGHEHGSASTQIDQLGHHLVLAGNHEVESHCMAILGAFAADVIEAAMALPGESGSLGVHRVEVAQDCLN